MITVFKYLKVVAKRKRRNCSPCPLALGQEIMGWKSIRGNLGYTIKESFLTVGEDKPWTRLCMEVEDFYLWILLGFLGLVTRSTRNPHGMPVVRGLEVHVPHSHNTLAWGMEQGCFIHILVRKALTNYNVQNFDINLQFQFEFLSLFSCHLNSLEIKQNGRRTSFERFQKKGLNF